MMRWQELLSTRRLGQSAPRRTDDHRSPFEIDVDRFVFCSAFRRLQSKMQVHGPSLHSDQPGDYVRNRLTHSLEVSRVGRSLGQIAGQYLIQRQLVEGITAADVGHIVSGAAISHDVGQTPFSHQGEQAISAWWKTSPIANEVLAGLPPEWRYELTRFEGNAFGFRLLTRLEGWQPNGGLQLTCATLAAFSKYPWSGVLPPDQRPHPMKYGIFASELDLFREVAEATGLIERQPGIWCRHPLAHLTEAADDICYRIVDVEDAVQIGALPFVEAEELLAPLADSQAAEYAGLVGVERKLTYLRARAISTLITDTLDVWRDLHDQMLGGGPIPPLLSVSKHKTQLDRIERITRSKIYRGERRAETMLIASRTIDVLLNGIAGMLLRREATKEDRELAIRDEATLDLLNRSRDPSRPLSRDRAGWVREMMDTIAAMTDHAAIRMAKIIAGGLG